MVARTRQFIMQHNYFDRSLLPGHLSGSAWIVNPARTHALMLPHRKLDF